MCGLLYLSLMEYKIETWTIGLLYEKFREDAVDLNPPYQRKFIWDLDDQRTLINSILHKAVSG